MTLTGKIKSHLVDSTAMVSIATPMYAGLEHVVLGMSNTLSLHARELGFAMTYAGLSVLVAKGRDKYRKLLHITDKTRERTQQFYDALYLGAYTFAVTPPFYYIAGSRDIEQIIAGTIMQTIVGTVSGSIVGYTIDLYRDLAGVRKSARIPKIIQDKNSPFKMKLAIALTIGSLALTTAIYTLIPNRNTEKQNTPTQYIQKNK